MYNLGGIVDAIVKSDVWDDVLEEEAKILKRRIKNVTPVRTGRLKRSVDYYNEPDGSITIKAGRKGNKHKAVHYAGIVDERKKFFSSQTSREKLVQSLRWVLRKKNIKSKLLDDAHKVIKKV